MAKKKSKLLFGPAGTPISAKSSSSVDGIRRVGELNLGCMELEFVRGVKMSATLARQVNQVAQENKVELTVHGPYFINLNAKDSAKKESSRERILQSCRIGYLCGATSVTFHAAYYGNDSKEEVYKAVKKELEEIVKILKSEKNPILIRPETTGKESQFGSLEEIMNLSREIEQVLPCIDFAHIHARSGGKYNSYKEFVEILSLLEKRLGKRALENMHIHVSGIEYSDKGEIKHLNLKESDFNYKDLLRALKDYNVSGVVISESPNLETDALLLQKTYLEIST